MFSFTHCVPLLSAMHALLFTLLLLLSRSLFFLHGFFSYRPLGVEPFLLAPMPLPRGGGLSLVPPRIDRRFYFPRKLCFRVRRVSSSFWPTGFPQRRERFECASQGFPPTPLFPASCLTVQLGGFASSLPCVFPILMDFSQLANLIVVSFS